MVEEGQAPGINIIVNTTVTGTTIINNDNYK